MWPLKCKQDLSKIWPSDLLFDPTTPIFERVQGLIITNILTKFEEDWIKIVASRVLTPLLTDARRTTDDGHSSITKAHLELCSGELKILDPRLTCSNWIFQETCATFMRAIYFHGVLHCIVFYKWTFKWIALIENIVIALDKCDKKKRMTVRQTDEQTLTLKWTVRVI